MRQRQEQIALIKANDYYAEWLTVSCETTTPHVILNKLSTIHFLISDPLPAEVQDQHSFRKNQIKTH